MRSLVVLGVVGRARMRRRAMTVPVVAVARRSRLVARTCWSPVVAVVRVRLTTLRLPGMVVLLVSVWRGLVWRSALTVRRVLTRAALPVAVLAGRRLPAEPVV